MATLAKIGISIQRLVSVGAVSTGTGSNLNWPGDTEITWPGDTEITWPGLT